MAAPYFVKFFVEDETYGEFVGEDGKNPADTAENCFRRELQREPKKTVSLPCIERISMDKVPDEYKENWPEGIKTLPVYLFRMS